MIHNWKNIDRDDVKQAAARPDVALIDVREKEEFAEVHIPGAVNIPLSELSHRIQEIDRDKELILVCRSGNRSAKACEYLSFLGFDKINNMAGGMLEWDGEILEGGKKP